MKNGRNPRLQFLNSWGSKLSTLEQVEEVKKYDKDVLQITRTTDEQLRGG
jgi:hypothetical protein